MKVECPNCKEIFEITKNRIRLIKLLEEEGDKLNISQICKKLDIDRAVVYFHAYKLEKEGILKLVKDRKRIGQPTYLTLINGEMK